MLDRCYHKLLLFGCLACLLVTVVSADGRVFVLDLRNSSDLWGFRDAEQACASHRGRLASVEELRHAVVECYFSPCTRGWLYGGSVGTTVCNVVGGVLKAVEVRTENGTEDAAHLDAFCIKDKDEPCGDPPSFPNARLQSHSGSEMGDELLYTCVPGYVMPGGHTAFSLLCDSCGEWYGLVQICVKGKRLLWSELDSLCLNRLSVVSWDGNGLTGEDHRDLSRKHKVGEEVAEGGKIFEGALVEQEKSDERAGEDLVSPRTWQQERTEVAKIDTVEATEAPVSLLSQKHMFWFPSETFQEEGPQSYDDHDSHEDDSRQHVIFSVVADEHQNVTQRGAEGKSATDDTWLDGYPVVFENGDSVTEKVKPEDKDRRRFFKTTPRPTEVEIRRPYTSSPKEHESLTTVREFELGVLEEVWPDSIGTPAPDLLEPSDSPSYSETGDYSTQQAVPTDSWMAGLTDHPFLDHGPSPPVHKDGFVLSLPGETGERGEQEGEMGETICVDDACPPLPPSSSSRGPTVAAIIVAICVVATAVIVAVWCYRRQQQKSSAYEMNGKGQSHARQGQQIEMQQKV
uniref:Sushi domain containing 5 n=1 Tax=Oreochromis niloticus TaxID=8128 RepID=I3J262_ORENI